MAVLDLIQNATKLMGIEVPTTVYGAADRELVELAHLANEVKDMIREGYDWSLLKRIHAISGDGTTAAFDMPADFDRFPKRQHVWSSRLEQPVQHVADQDAWLEIQVKDYATVVGVWTRYGGQMHFKPPLAATETVQFFYLSDRAVRPAGTSAVATDRAVFQSDSDEFRLPGRLLELGLVWRWRQMKGLPYAEDLQTYEMTRANLQMRDQPAGVIAVGVARWPRGVDLAYPRSVG